MMKPIQDDFIDILSVVIDESQREHALVENAVDVRELRAQVKQLEFTLNDILVYKDSAPKGSARRTDFSRVVQRLRDQIKRLSHRINRMSMTESVTRADFERLFEGGAAGHMMHLYDNRDITFGEIKDVFERAASGKLERVSEKFDGQNLYISCDADSKILYSARSAGDIKRGGLDRRALVDKFKGRGTVYDAFVSAFDVIQNAIVSIQSDTLRHIFGDKHTTWYSIEVIYPENPNVIMYDSNNIILHRAGVKQYNVDTNELVNVTADDEFDTFLNAVTGEMHTRNDKTWSIIAPNVVNLQKLDDDVKTRAISRLNAVMSKYGIDDSDTVTDYIKTSLYYDFLDKMGSHDVKMLLIDKLIGTPGALSITNIIKIDKQHEAEIRNVMNSSLDIMKRVIFPIESIVSDFSVEVLRFVNSALIMDNTREVERIRNDVRTAIDAIQQGGSTEKIAIVNAQLERMKLVDNIVSAVEGIVFTYKGNTYKFTGLFAPINQILGLFKYGRGKQDVAHEQDVREESVDKNRTIMTMTTTKRQNINEIGDAIIDAFNVKFRLDEKKSTELDVADVVSPKSMQYGTWTQWPKSVKHVKYDGGTGVGPGEHKLAALFGGTVQGGSVSYDVIAADGSTWEVKEPDNSTEIRPGTHGLAAISSIMQEFIAIVNQIEQAFTEIDGEVIDNTFSSQDGDVVKNIKTFVENDVPLIRKGEISRGRIFGSSAQKSYSFVDVLRELNRLMLPKRNVQDMKREITYADKKYHVDTSTYIHVGNILNVPEVDMNVDPSDVFKAKLHHPAFRRPVEFIERYMTSITPNIVFGKTDGVILVRPDAFMIIPLAKLNDSLKFSRITQGKPKFKYV